MIHISSHLYLYVFLLIIIHFPTCFPRSPFLSAKRFSRQDLSCPTPWFTCWRPTRRTTKLVNCGSSVSVFCWAMAAFDTFVSLTVEQLMAVRGCAIQCVYIYIYIVDICRLSSPIMGIAMLTKQYNECHLQIYPIRQTFSKAADVFWRCGCDWQPVLESFMTNIDHTVLWCTMPIPLLPGICHPATWWSYLEVMVGGQAASGLEGPLAHEVGVNFGITSQIATMALLAVVVLDA